MLNEVEIDPNNQKKIRRETFVQNGARVGGGGGGGGGFDNGNRGGIGFGLSHYGIFGVSGKVSMGGGSSHDDKLVVIGLGIC